MIVLLIDCDSFFNCDIASVRKSVPAVHVNALAGDIRGDFEVLDLFIVLIHVMSAVLACQATRFNVGRNGVIERLLCKGKLVGRHDFSLALQALVCLFELNIDREVVLVLSPLIHHNRTCLHDRHTLRRIRESVECIEGLQKAHPGLQASDMVFDNDTVDAVLFTSERSVIIHVDIVIGKKVCQFFYKSMHKILSLLSYLYIYYTPDFREKIVKPLNYLLQRAFLRTHS